MQAIHRTSSNFIGGTIKPITYVPGCCFENRRVILLAKAIKFKQNVEIK